MSDRPKVVPLRRNQADTFDVFYASQLEGYVPENPEWVIDGVLLRGTVLVLGGIPKIGKSLLAQQMLASIATGSDWLGTPTVASRCFGMFCEDPDEQLKRRGVDILAYLDRDPASLELDLSWQSRDGKDAMLIQFERYGTTPKFTDLWYQLWEFVADDRAEIIGIDTAAAVFGGNENARDQVTRFLLELQKKAVEINGCIILTAHPPKGSPNGLSGTNAWLASARAGLSLGRPDTWNELTREPANERVLRGMGMNYGAGITSKRLEYQDGVFVAAEPDHGDGGRHGPLNHIERQDLKYRMLTGLKRNVMKGNHVAADELDPRSLPSRARRQTDPAIAKVALNDLYQAQHELIDGGLAVVVRVGNKLLLRAHDGPFYLDESPYLPPPAPEPER